MFPRKNVCFPTCVSFAANIPGQRYFACCIGSKGDMKHQMQLGNLNRSYHTMSGKQKSGMCSLCLAGTDGVPFTDCANNPQWLQTLYAVKPWDNTPPLGLLPFNAQAPEKMYTLDPFHLFKVGMGRDICGSSIATLARLGHFDDPNAPDESLAFPSRLERAHKSFELWCLANRCKAGLRSFTVQFFNIANKSSSPWTNSKGSDTMLMLRWLLWLVSLLLLTRGDSPPEHVQFFKLLKHTIESAQSMFHIMHSHPLWIKRSCGRLLYTRCMLMLRGYKALARRTMTLQIGGYRLKPKFHGLHHVAQFVKDALQRGAPLLLNPLCFACEPNEDTVGRICRLSRKLATRTLTRRLLQRHFLKKGALLRRSKDIRKCSLK